MSATTLRLIKYIAAISVLVAILTYVGPTSFEDAKRDEAYNCANFPTAFSYCADVLARAGE